MIRTKRTSARSSVLVVLVVGGSLGCESTVAPALPAFDLHAEVHGTVTYDHGDVVRGGLVGLIHCDRWLVQDSVSSRTAVDGTYRIRVGSWVREAEKAGGGPAQCTVAVFAGGEPFARKLTAVELTPLDEGPAVTRVDLVEGDWPEE